MVRKNRTINLNDLTAFSEVARAGGISAAGEALGVSKSTVSTQITRLEGKLGVRLLTRSSRRVALTREGQRVLPRVLSLLVEVDHLIEDIADQSSKPRGSVRIATTPAFGSFALNSLFPAVSKAYPDIRLIVSPTYSFNDLQDPTFDFAIRIGRIKDEHLVSRKVGQFRRLLVASPDYAETHPATSPDDLRDQKCLMFSDRIVDHEWRVCRKDNNETQMLVPIEAAIAVRDFDPLREFARNGQGVAFLPEFLVQDDFNSGSLVDYLPDWQSLPTDVLLAYRFGATNITRVKAIVELTADILAHALHLVVE